MLANYHLKSEEARFFDDLIGRYIIIRDTLNELSLEELEDYDAVEYCHLTDKNKMRYIFNNFQRLDIVMLGLASLEL